MIWSGIAEIQEGSVLMRIQQNFIHSTFLLFTAIVIACSGASAQTVSSEAAQQEVAVNSSASKTATANVPVFTDYRGVKIGMTSDEVRGKLDRIKKGERQDFLVFSEHESAQIYYDDKGRVTAISIDYFGDKGAAPSPEVVLGASLQAKPDGSMYQLNRYPEAGYWVSYNRTAGDKPIVTITMQKM
jgi:hypothetical protein